MFLVERLDTAAGEPMKHIKARPVLHRLLSHAVLRPAAGFSALLAHWPPAARQAVCFLRPTGENVAVLRRHLRKPKFGEYHVCAFLPRLRGSVAFPRSLTVAPQSSRTF